MVAVLNAEALKRSTEIARTLARHWDRGWFAEDGREEDGDRPSLSEDLEGLGPTFIKLGQMLATRPDIAPPSVRADLERLHSSVEPVEAAEIRGRVEAELGAPVSRLFTDFDDRALGTASLAQVHRAHLRDGTPVVVKVLRPGAAEQVEKDLELLGSVTDWIEDHTRLETRFGLCSTIREFERSLRRELDYRAEAHNLERIAEITEGYERIRVPRIVGDYSSRSVLTMERMEGSTLAGMSPMARMELDLEPAARQLFRAYLDQALVHGFVHADPHPGNLIALEDGRVGVIDLGMVTVVPAELRAELVQLALAVAEGDGSAAARIAERVGEPLEEYDPDQFLSRVATQLATRSGTAVGHGRLGEALIAITRAAGACGLRVPSSLALLGKTLLNLEQVGTLLDPGFDPAREFQDYAPTLVKERLLDEVDPAAALRKALEAEGFLAKLPHRADQILDRLARGDFTMRVHVEGEERIVSGLGRVANRVAHALVLAALIVGASLLMNVDTDFELLGYPGLAIVLFLLAVAGGAHLLWLITKDGLRKS